MKKRKKNIWILSIVALIIIIVIILKVSLNKKGESVTLGRASITDITERIPANGKIKPVTEIKISPDVSGEIVELNVDEGDEVHKGDLIIKIRQDIYISLRDRAEASLNSVKAQYIQQTAQFEQAQLDFKRNKVLYEKKAISTQEYEKSNANYAMAKGQLDAAEFNIASAEASLKEAEENLLKTTIYSPIDGIVSSLSVEKGERVVGTSQMAGTEMLRIADFNKMEVAIDVNENDIIRIEEGDTAIIDVDAYPGKTFKGTVTKIANSAKNVNAGNDQITNFEVKVEILPDSYRDLSLGGKIPFRPGMSASVEIETVKKTGILSIPLQSVIVRDNIEFDEKGIGKSGEYVFLYDKGSSTVKAEKITTGIQDLNNIEILSGNISDSTVIVTGPYNMITKILNDGTKVVPINKL